MKLVDAQRDRLMIRSLICQWVIGSVKVTVRLTFLIMKLAPKCCRVMHILKNSVRFTVVDTYRGNLLYRTGSESCTPAQAQSCCRQTRPYGPTGWRHFVNPMRFSQEVTRLDMIRLWLVQYCSSHWKFEIAPSLQCVHDTSSCWKPRFSTCSFKHACMYTLWCIEWTGLNTLHSNELLKFCPFRRYLW